MRRLLIIAALIAVFAAGFLLRGGDDDVAGVHDRADATVETWTCSMHPQIRLPEPGQCPVCFMDLIPLESDDGPALGPRSIRLSPEAVALAEIVTAPVERQTLGGALRLTGRIVADETRVRTVAARTAGRVDTLFVDAEGLAVRRGDPLLAIDSPDLYAAQTELLGAARLAGDDPRLLDAARERLRRWGLTDTQVRAIETRGEASRHQRLVAPIDGVVLHRDVAAGDYVREGSPLYTVADLSNVWIELDAHESDLPRLTVGASARFTAAALPGRTFEATVVFVDPVLDPRSRSAAVRLVAENPDGALRPGVFVGADVEGGGSDVLTIPASAPLITGERAVVYVRDPDADRPEFAGREVSLGPRVGDRYVVVDGLREGERVAARGAFKIDSALQIQAKPSMMSAPSEVPAGIGVDLTPLLGAYLAFQAALSEDDDAAAAAAARDALSAVEDLGDWNAAARLSTLFRSAAAADTISGRRAVLREVTDRLWPALSGGVDAAGTYRLMHCPMVDRGAGADWIQTDPLLANPYFGAAMLRCGNQTDSLVVRGGAS